MNDNEKEQNGLIPSTPDTASENAPECNVDATATEVIATESTDAAAKTAEPDVPAESLPSTESIQTLAEATLESDETDEPKRVNYHTYTKDELVAALLEIVQNEENTAHKKVNAIKQAFYALRNKEIQEELEAYVEQGNQPDTFTASVDAVESEMKDLLSKFRDMRAEYLAKEEVCKQENLAKKCEIITKIQQLTEDIDNINLRFPEFQQLQAEFKLITDIPSGDVAETWKRYQVAVEQFYDRLKMNKELRDLDFKKNLEYKRSLIDEAKTLTEKADIVAAFRHLQELHDKWRETGPVAKELRESIWDEFKSISTIINKRHQDYFEARKLEEQANEEAKTKLCEQIEEIKIDEIKSIGEWNEQTKRVLELQAEWKKIGFASRKINQALFTRFRKVCDEFFAKKAEFFRVRKDEYAVNLAKKTALCEKVEALKETSEDPLDAMSEVVKAQGDWRKIGSVSNKVSDSIWRRFVEACNYFYDERKRRNTAVRQEENANLAAKRAVITALQNINPEEMDRNEAINQVRELQTQWNNTGHVPFRRKDALYAEYRQIIDTLYSQLNMRRDRARMSNFEERLSELGSDESRLLHERDRLSRAYETKKTELKTIENNMGFFNVKSAAGNSMMRDMERRIKRVREEMELLAGKISAVNGMLHGEE